MVRVEIGDKLGDVTDTLSLLNSGMTFFLYCFMSQQFRTVFSQVFLHPVARRCSSMQPVSPNGPRAGRRTASMRAEQGSLTPNTLLTKCNSSAAACNGERRSAPVRSDESETRHAQCADTGRDQLPPTQANTVKKQLQVTIADHAPEASRNEKLHFI